MTSNTSIVDLFLQIPIIAGKLDYVKNVHEQRCAYDELLGVLLELDAILGDTSPVKAHISDLHRCIDALRPYYS